MPIKIEYKNLNSSIKWTKNIEELDYNQLLPIFFDGIREKTEPYRFVAIQGLVDLLEKGGLKVFSVIPQLVIPIKSIFY